MVAEQAGRILPREPQAERPLSFAQERLWFLDQLEPDRSVYHLHRAVRIGGELPHEALQQALNVIVDRHEVLRTTFVAVEGKPEQVLGVPRSVELRVIDLTGWRGASREGEVQRLLAEETHRPFDLSRDLLLRAALLRLADEEAVLFLVAHQIACDEWALGVLLRELSALYAVFAAAPHSRRPSLSPAPVHPPLPLPELPIQYADFAAWQRRRLRGEVLQEQLAYWKRHLDRAPALLELPTDRPRPTVQSYHGAVLPFALSTRVTAGLQALCRREGCPLFVLLLAAFKTLLARCSGQEDLLVGTPVANRSRLELEGLIGCFADALVLRTDLSGDPRFRELLERVRDSVRRAYGHQELPFEKLVDELRPKRSLSHSPLFQVMFSLQEAPGAPLEMAGLTLQELELAQRTAKFDLSLFVRQDADRLAGAIEYNTDLFDAARIRRMAGHLATLLEGIVADPDERLSRLPLLTAAEREQLLAVWNETRPLSPSARCVHELVEAQVARTPDAIAVAFGGHELTYRELDARSNQLARYLRQRGVGPDVPVGLCVERSVEMVVGVLGILKAGGAYVPLDPAYPRERLAVILEEAQAPLLVTQHALLPCLPAHAATVVCLDTHGMEIGRERAERVDAAITAEHLAYVIYTSGSTGRPKGVAMSHQALVNLIAWHEQSLPLVQGARVLQFASLCFDVSFQEIFSTWSGGGTLVLVTEEMRRDPPRLWSFIQAEAITRAFLPVVALQQLAEAAESSEPGAIPLREVITAGEQLQITRSVADLFQRLAGCLLHNHYGPTETHVVTAYRLESPPAEWPALPPIGRPIANTQIYLLDAHLQLVPVGIPGELYVGGTALAQGYLNQPELTAERFIPNPFLQKQSRVTSREQKAEGRRQKAEGSPDERNAAGKADALSGLPSAFCLLPSAPDPRLYKTGDLARYLPDGNIEYLGRIDDQTKIRGFRIEPGEITTVLARHPAVRESVVVAREDLPGERRLVAYVVAQPEPAVSVAELRSYLKEKLPEYMVPSAFVMLPALPLTANGKVDRAALPVPDRALSLANTAAMAPRDPLEIGLARIWEELLGLQDVGVTDDFFDLGGHSLLAARLFAQIEKLYRKKLPLAAFFQEPTIDGLARLLRTEDFPADDSELLPLQLGGSGPPLFVVAPTVGDVRPICGLIHALGADVPAYGLGVQGLDAQRDGRTPIPLLASHYVQQIRAFQPEGPYLLSGYCFGGFVAFEMAQQLQAEGQEVALLALIEPDSPRRRSLLREACDLRRALGQLPARRRLGAIIAGLAAGLQRRVRKITRACYEHLKPVLPHIPALADNAEFARYVNTLERVQRAYVPRVYPGRVILFQASERPAALDAQHIRLGWESLAAEGLETHDIPGDHLSIFWESHLRVLADKLRTCLRNAVPVTTPGEQIPTAAVPRPHPRLPQRERLLREAPRPETPA